MLTPEHLSQTLVRLKPSEEWTGSGEGLCFLFQQRGSGKYVSDDSMQKILPGDLLVFSGSVPARLTPFNGSPITFRYFSVHLDHLVALFTSREIALLQGVTDGLKRARYFAAATPLARQCHILLNQAPQQLSLEHRSHLLRIVAVILSEEFKNARALRHGTATVDEHVAQVLESLSSEDILNLSVEQLAGRFGCTRRHLNRLFHTYFGVSVSALKMEMRLLKAVALLQNPEIKIIHVAEQCGFNHQGLFNTVFKKRFGTSPGQWRKLPPTSGDSEAGLADAPEASQARAAGGASWGEGGPAARLPFAFNLPQLSKL